MDGDGRAMSNLGFFFEEDPLDYAKAREWFEKAVAVGNAEAMNSLGVLY